MLVRWLYYFYTLKSDWLENNKNYNIFGKIKFCWEIKLFYKFCGLLFRDTNYWLILIRILQTHESKFHLAPFDIGWVGFYDGYLIIEVTDLSDGSCSGTIDAWDFYYG